MDTFQNDLNNEKDLGISDGNFDDLSFEGDDGFGAAVLKEQTKETKPAEETSAADNDNDQLIDLSAYFEKAAKEDVDDAGDTSEQSNGSTQASPKRNREGASSYSQWAEAFKEKGAIASADEFKDVKTEEEFFDKLTGSLREKIIGELSVEQQHYLKSLEKGVPTDYYHQNVSAIRQLENVSDDMLKADDAAQLRQMLIKNHLVAKGIDEETATTQAEIAASSEKGADLAIAAKKSIIEVAQNRIKDKEKEFETQAEKDLEVVNTLREQLVESKFTIPGMKLSAEDRQKAFDVFAKPVGKDATGRPINAIEQAMRDRKAEVNAAVALLFHLSDGFTKMDKLATRFTNVASKKFEEAANKSALDSFGKRNVVNRAANSEDVEAGRIAVKSAVASLKASGFNF